MLFLDLFQNDSNLVRIAAGKCLFREGDVGDVMYVLIGGEAEISMGGLSIEVCHAGDVVGEMAVIDDSRRLASVHAKTDCRFAAVDKARFHALIKESPEFAIEVMRIMAKRLKHCDMRLLGSTP